VILHTELGLTLPAAIATVTATPAARVGLGDRGEIAVGRRADLLRVRVLDGLPVLRGVWRQGDRIG
jgi:alpha-D-ribose 1-methylphosphonate 5-triphosphate diphosphatase